VTPGPVILSSPAHRSGLIAARQRPGRGSRHAGGLVTWCPCARPRWSSGC